MLISTITSKGQTTIPIEIRELLHLKPGDKIAFDVTDNRVTLRAKNLPITALRGILRSRAAKPPSLKKMQADMEASVARHVLAGMPKKSKPPRRPRA